MSVLLRIIHISAVSRNKHVLATMYATRTAADHWVAVIFFAIDHHNVPSNCNQQRTPVVVQLFYSTLERLACCNLLAWLLGQWIHHSSTVPAFRKKTVEKRYCCFIWQPLQLMKNGVSIAILLAGPDKVVGANEEALFSKTRSTENACAFNI